MITTVDALNLLKPNARYVLRGDELGVSAQVMIGSSAAVDGIAREISEPVRALIDNFWPGQLSINLKPQRGLNWDLGDGQQLDSFSVRVPSADFILQQAHQIGLPQVQVFPTKQVGIWMNQ